MRLDDKRKAVGWLEDHIGRLKKMPGAQEPERKAAIERLESSRNMLLKEIAIAEAKDAQRTGYDGSGDYGWGD